MIVNKNANFHTLCQGDDKFTRMGCPVFAPAVNLKFNCNITLSENDCVDILQKMECDGKRSQKDGARGSDGVKYTLSYLKENKTRLGIDKIPKLKTFSRWRFNQGKMKKYLKKGYAVLIGIGVTRGFVKDAGDGVIEDYKDYKNYKGRDLLHFTNCLTWIGRGTFKEKDYKDYILDSYAFSKNRENLYECNNKELFEDLTFNTKYIFTYE